MHIGEEQYIRAQWESWARGLLARLIVSAIRQRDLAFLRSDGGDALVRALGFTKGGLWLASEVERLTTEGVISDWRAECDQLRARVERSRGKVYRYLAEVGRYGWYEAGLGCLRPRRDEDGREVRYGRGQ